MILAFADDCSVTAIDDVAQASIHREVIDVENGVLTSIDEHAAVLRTDFHKADLMLRGKAGAFGGTLYRNEQDVFMRDDGAYSRTLIDFARKRHGGRVKVAFCDGRVGQGKRLFLDLDAAALRRWNKAASVTPSGE